MIQMNFRGFETNSNETTKLSTLQVNNCKDNISAKGLSNLLSIVLNSFGIILIGYG